MNYDALRNRLHERVCRLSHEKLHALEKFLASLESDEAKTSNRGEREPPAADGGFSPIIGSKHWPHAPLHRICEQGTYMVTAGTLFKEHYFHTAKRLDYLESKFLELAKQYDWQIEAWAVFSNHYHFIGHSPEDVESLKSFLGQLHCESARFVNQLDGETGRQVWHNYWETHLTFERSYFARLNYVHHNPEKHGLVPVASQYRWCSAAWFERTARPAQVKTIYSFKTDMLCVLDDFHVLAPIDE